MTDTREQLERYYGGEWAQGLFLSNVDADQCSRRAQRVWQLDTPLPSSRLLFHQANEIDAGGSLGLALPPGVMAIRCETSKARYWLWDQLSDHDGRPLPYPWQFDSGVAHFIVRLPTEEVWGPGDSEHGAQELIFGTHPTRHLPCGDVELLLGGTPNGWIPVQLGAWQVPLPKAVAELEVIPADLLRALTEAES